MSFYESLISDKLTGKHSTQEPTTHFILKMCPITRAPAEDSDQPVKESEQVTHGSYLGQLWVS